MEQLIYKMHHGEKLPQSLYEKVKQYQPDIELEQADKHPHKKLLITQLYPLLLQQKY